MALLGTVALLAGLVGSAQASTITINPASPEPGSGNFFPFGAVTTWPPYAGFVYKNILAFSLKPGDKLAFDLSLQNDVNIQLQIDMAATTVNGGDVQTAAGFSTLVTSSEVPQNPRGNTTTGDYELAFPVQLPFNFPGGGLIIRFSNPAGAFASDTTGDGVLVNRANSADPSGNFVERFNSDANGLSPWSNVLASEVGGFRLTIADAPTQNPGNGTPNPATGAQHHKCKKHKKKHKRAAAAKKHKKHKKCKKGHKHKKK